jgi:hypothetical protein
MVYTIDTELMIRQWDIKTGICKKSYILETRED